MDYVKKMMTLYLMYIELLIFYLLCLVLESMFALRI